METASLCEPRIHGPMRLEWGFLTIRVAYKGPRAVNEFERAETVFQFSCCAHVQLSPSPLSNLIHNTARSALQDEIAGSTSMTSRCAARDASVDLFPALSPQALPGRLALAFLLRQTKSPGRFNRPLPLTHRFAPTSSASQNLSIAMACMPHVLASLALRHAILSPCSRTFLARPVVSMDP